MKNGSPAEALDRILKSARQALVYVEDLDIQSFLADLRTNREFVMRYPDFPWAMARGMRNQIVHNYAETDFSMVWRTTIENLPKLVEQLPAMIAAADAEWPPEYESKS